VPVIRITDATWDRLKKWAEPLEDSPEDAIRKVLEAAEEHLNCQHQRPSKYEEQKTLPEKVVRLQKGLRTPMKAYRRPILEAVYELGGSGPADSVLGRVEEKMRPSLKDVDYEELPSGVDIRWRNAAQWERLLLVKEGFLKADSPRGIWALSEKGIKEVSKNVI